MTHSVPTILEVMADRKLCGPWFSGASWAAWRAALAALFALPMSEVDAALFRACTGRQDPPSAPAREGWLIVGRRGGKSRAAALVAVFLACFRDYRSILAPGERGTLMVIAADRKQARAVFRYIAGMLDGVPMFARLITGRTAESIDLSTRVSIEVHTASYRAVRGYTIVGAICDEVAFWRSEESATPDVEILNGLRPGMATVPGALLLCISSPYARRGALWDAHRAHFGRDDDPVLVWKADTRTMNPRVDERVIADAYARDEAAARADFGAEFRADVEDYVDRDVVEAAVVLGRRELPPMWQRRYFAFCDPAGGSGGDSMTLAIAHGEHDKVVLDLLQEARPPFSPEEVVAGFAATLKTYGISRVSGDRYAGEWPREAFRRSGVAYAVAERSKSELYRELLPVLNSRKVELLDDRRLVAQLLGLERRTSWGGRDTIDHGPGAHDDVVNVAAGALVTARGTRRSGLTLALAGPITVRTTDAGTPGTGRPAMF